jgi:NADH-quinone oxidoreductase subunit M
MPILAILVALPLVSALIIALLPNRRSELVYPVAVGLSMMPLVAAAYILWNFVTGDGGFQFTENIVFSETIGFGWRMGIDGISLFMVALTALLFPISIIASRSVTTKTKPYMVLMLILEAGVLGVFLALDLLLFFAFFEIVLVPMFMLIALWGSDNRAYASMKFVLFTATGSAFLLASIIVVGLITGDAVGTLASFSFEDMLGVDFVRSTQMWLFAGFAIAFAIKVPLFPFHTWLPDAHTEAPTAGSVILAGVLLKMGTYGLLRFNLTLFPDATVSFAFWMALLGVVGIVYGAAVAIVQPDIKRLVAYSSVSHMGFIVLGIFALTTQGLQGSVFQMISHGLATGALFLLIGMIYDRMHTRKIAEFGGVAKVMPIYAGIFLFAAFASAGLPGLAGFIGEFTIFMGSYLSFPVLAIIAGSGIILVAIYLLWAYERVFTGPVTNPKVEALRDLNFREIAILIPLVLLIVGLGVYPKPVFERIQPSVDLILERITEQTDYQVPEFGSTGEVVEPHYGELKVESHEGGEG